MGNFDNNRFASNNQQWETPDDLFDRLNNEYHFTRDVCASKENAKCSDYWTEEDSCLNKQWDGINWMNPPYKDMKKFIYKAFCEMHNAVTVCLLPARTNTKWFHELCLQGHIYLICGRPKFKGCIHGFPQPLMLVVFGKGNIGKVESFYL